MRTVTENQFITKGGHMRSDRAKKGLERAPHRSLFKAMGYTDEEIKQPLVGIVNAKNEIIPNIYISIPLQKCKSRSSNGEEPYRISGN